MGQKVHPLGFRVGITKKHQSQWFARFNKNKYSQSVLEDRMIRDTLSKLFPELLNPVLNKTQKRDEESSITPRITQIKIERGLIPYEIGIQIHAENCDILKSAIDNLKVKRELIVKLQKTRRYLLNLKLKLKDFTNNSSNTESNSISSELNDSSNFKKTKGLKSKLERKKVGFNQRRFRRGSPKLTKQELRRQRLIKKRLNKRKSIRRRYRQLILKGLFIKKTGSKITQTCALKTQKTRTKMQSLTASHVKISAPQKNAFSSRIKKKFVTIFIQKMNKKFLAELKALLSNYSNQASEANLLGLGISKKWSFEHRVASLKMQPIYKLNKMVSVLEQKLLVKLESLRKEFIAFGSISARSAQSIGYFQILTFLKHLKELVQKLKREQKLNQSISKTSQISTEGSLGSPTSGLSNLVAKMHFVNNLKLEQSGTVGLAQTVLAKKLSNVDDECRKIKFIEYLKDIVKKHRTQNLYLYLATLSDARKDLRQIKQFVKQHADFLFGLNLSNGGSSGDSFKEKIHQRVSKVLENSAKKGDFEKTFQDVFLEQIEKQRTMCLQNLQLTPKISIKFYSVNPKTLQQKASIVAASVVDALEQRKAFRKVIKDAKENLMRSPGVKGVKIQVAGRLNGAEIARTEWVRAGRVPLQTLKANLDYSYKTASTIYGIIGVRVWIFKGYVKLITQQ
nr:ribosomal protein S3 [Chlamydomonas sp. UWO 241]